MPLSTNLFGHGSERISIDLRAGSTAYLSADPQLGIMTPGRITFVQVTENQGRRRRQPASDQRRVRQARRFAVKRSVRRHQCRQLIAGPLAGGRNASAAEVTFALLNLKWRGRRSRRPMWPPQPIKPMGEAGAGSVLSPIILVGMHSRAYGLISGFRCA
jgi:hypothetical protein